MSRMKKSTILMGLMTVSLSLMAQKQSEAYRGVKSGLLSAVVIVPNGERDRIVGIQLYGILLGAAAAGKAAKAQGSGQCKSEQFLFHGSSLQNERPKG